MTMLALTPIDTTELTDLVTTPGATAFEVMQRAQVAWSVAKMPVYLGNGHVVPNHFATVRSDNGRTLGMVGNRYTVIQNQNGLDLFDAAAARGAVEYGRAGTFKGGAVVWMQAKLPNSITVGPDEVAKYLLLANTHDGSGTLRILLTPIRVVCKNTLAAAIAADAGMTIRHTFSGEQKVRTAIAAIERAGRFYETFAIQANAMHARRMTYSQVTAYVDAVFPLTGDSAKPSARLEGIRGQVIDLHERGAGQYAIRGTAWGAYNAVAEYVDHSRSTRGDEGNRLESAWLGSGAAIKRRAFDLAIAG